jgi:hypothetical protein
LFQTRKEFPHVPFNEIVDVVGVVADRGINRLRSRRDAGSNGTASATGH